MRKRIFLVLLAALLLTTAGCGVQVVAPETSPSPTASAPVQQSPSATPSETGSGASTKPKKDAKPETSPAPEIAEPDYSEIYGATLDGFCRLIQNSDWDYDVKEGEFGVLEAVMHAENGDAASVIGYAIRDISGDGAPELLIGAVTQQDDTAQYGGEIYAVYTCVNGSPYCTLEGSARSCYRYMGDGEFLYQGSGGAMHSMFGIYAITPDGHALSCKSFYFSFEKDESFTDIGFYRNTSGDCDVSVSEELSDDEFWDTESILVWRTRSMELTPFSAISGESAPAEQPQVRVQWAEGGLDSYSSYEVFIADTSDARARVAFTSDSGVSDFKLLALDLDGVDDSGNVSFSVRELYAPGKLTPERPLVVEMTLNGTIPSYGVSYTGADGSVRRFAVELSGEDGSLLLREL